MPLESPDAGLSSGSLRAPELRTASRTPVRSTHRLRRKLFFDFCKDCFEFGVSLFGQFLTILVDFRSYLFLPSVFLSCVLGAIHDCKAAGMLG